MKTLIIGSSNTTRFLKFLDEKEKSKVDIRKCTKFKSFEALMDELDETEPHILISVIVNTLCATW